MSRFKRLTDAEARTLTRRELLDRIEAEGVGPEYERNVPRPVPPLAEARVTTFDKDH